MFAQGATPGKVDSWSYDEENEDFTKGKRESSTIQLVIELNYMNRCYRFRYLGIGPTSDVIPKRIIRSCT